MSDLSNWRKSSFSYSNGQCVEVGTGAASVGVRDTALDRSPVLTFGAGEWRRFTALLRADDHLPRLASADLLAIVIAVLRSGRRHLGEMDDGPPCAPPRGYDKPLRLQDGDSPRSGAR